MSVITLLDVVEAVGESVVLWCALNASMPSGYFSSGAGEMLTAGPELRLLDEEILVISEFIISSILESLSSRATAEGGPELSMGVLNTEFIFGGLPRRDFDLATVDLNFRFLCL